MPAVKVLIVDDAKLMRMLYTSALESSPEIVVVGAAADANEAREMIAQYHPHVMTLDVEMPGMNGIDFLEEVMRKAPMPVVMVSGHVAEGSSWVERAKALGAYASVPKLRTGNPAETQKSYAVLCETVLAAARAPVAVPAPATPASAPADAPAGPGLSVIASGDLRASTQAVMALAADCLPTILLIKTDRNAAAVTAMMANVAIPKVVEASDGMALLPGVVHVVATAGMDAIVDGWPNGAIRLTRQASAPSPPSLDRLLASVAQTAGKAASIEMLPGLGSDGSAGLAAARAARVAIVELGQAA